MYSRKVLPDGMEYMKLDGNKNMYNELIRRWPAFDNGINIRTLNNEVNRNVIEALTYSLAKRKNVPDANNKHAANGMTHFDTRTVTVADNNGAYTIDLSIAKLTDGSKVSYAKKNVARGIFIFYSWFSQILFPCTNLSLITQSESL